MTTGGYVPDRGDVVWISLNPQAGHEQAGRRPAVVLVLVFVSGASAGFRALGLALVFALVAFACVGFGVVLRICFIAIGETSRWVIREP